MVQTKETSGQPQEYVLISIDEQNNVYKAIGIYKEQEQAYAAALVNQMQFIESVSDSWPKEILEQQQENIVGLCNRIKELSTYKERFEHMTAQCKHIFKDTLHIRLHVLAKDTNKKEQVISESIFKTKLRNFLDVLQTKSDVEEDLGNSEDEEEDEEEEDLEEEEEEDFEEEEEDLEEESEESEEEQPSTTNVVPETTEDELEEEEEGGSALKRDASALDEDEEEDEIDDDDELEDDEVLKKRRVIA